MYQSAIIPNHFAGLNVSLHALKNSYLEQLNLVLTKNGSQWLPFFI
ncbi:hypothetical protein PMAN_a0068 [Pseudoalteromonas marina]|nr:hypothetical protein PMAN_a0068 [Pseudoalteromonas marina]